jgi:hypothetical protein
MALNFFDSSALIKRYVTERGTSRVEELCATDDVAFSILAVAEVASALGRRTREGSLSEDQRDEIYQTFLSDMEEYQIIGVTEAVTRQAAVLLLTCPPNISIRTLDALHLATAQEALGGSSKKTGRFVTADQRLIAAAALLGVEALNPEVA